MTDETPIEITDEKVLRMLTLLHGITAIQVTFSGGGDSGQIDRIFFACSDKDIHNLPVTITSKEKNFHIGVGWKEEEFSRQGTLYEWMENYVYSRLEEANIDYSNNGGGFGNWSWTPQDGIDFEVYVNHSESSLEYSEQRQLGDPYDVGVYLL